MFRGSGLAAGLFLNALDREAVQRPSGASAIAAQKASLSDKLCAQAVPCHAVALRAKFWAITPESTEDTNIIFTAHGAQCASDAIRPNT